ncbi:MAG: endonuclease MutS2 [Ruminococcaceae bacterium]|nr:endonuclease MutS2 [Oscillospiraceae bacterium]
MNEKNIYTLEFNKIRELLASKAQTEGAVEMALSLMPSDDVDEVKLRQRRCADAKRLAGQKGNPSFGSVRDISSALERSDKGATLSTRELLDCANVLRTSRGLLEYIKSDRKFDTSLDEIFLRLSVHKKIEDQIYRAIISEDMIADEASAELSDIRHKIRKTNAKIADLMQRYTMGGSFSKYLQENIVTTRGGRFVIPVKSEYRNEVKGLVHDTSASGATLFIEPMSVVEANNELRELQSREEFEIERILSELSALIASVSGLIRLNYSNITLLAFCFACSELSYAMNAVEPEINAKGAVRLENCRHPLIAEGKAVPVTVEVGGEWSMLVITGPNTGGKTVSLKTLGLFSMMAQAGLQLPCEKASVRVFDEIFSDIGDEQSIEQSLSTFSSHMVGIVNILNDMTENSLVLFDELGSGTDPVEGAALAMSILEEVFERGALCAATTHYAELKAFALEKEGVCNASCEFNVDTLKPTYKLIIGTPGKSNAFAISEKLGIPERIVTRAKGYVDSGSRSFEAVIEKLEEERYRLMAEREKAETLRREYEEYKKNAEAELQRRLGSAEREAEEAKKKARQIVDSARATSDYILKQLDDAKKAKDAENFGDKISDARKNIKNEVKSYRQSNAEEDKDDGYVLPRPLKKGDDVIHRTLGSKGTLIEDPDKKGNVTVQMGILKTKLNVSQLKLVEGATVTENGKKSAAKTYRQTVSKNFKPELDVRGMIGDDACFMVDRYLDDACIAQIYSVTVIHGKGTGALRAAIWSFLKKDKRVESFRAGQYGEGDFGVTVIDLKHK